MSLLIASMLVLGSGAAQERSLSGAIEEARCGQYSIAGNSGATDCSGVLALDFNAIIQSGVDPTLVLGTVVDGQFWYRDGAASFHTGLSEAIEFAIGP